MLWPYNNSLTWSFRPLPSRHGREAASAMEEVIGTSNRVQVDVDVLWQICIYKYINIYIYNINMYIV